MCSACDEGETESTKLTNARKADIPGEVWRLPKTTPDEDENKDVHVPVSDNITSKRRRGAVSLSSDLSLLEAPRKKVSFLSSFLAESHYDYGEPIQSNFHILNQAKHRNGLRGPPIAYRNHGIGLDYPVNLGSPPKPHHMLSNDGSSVPGSSWHMDPAPQQKRDLRLPQPLLSKKCSAIQLPICTALYNNPCSQNVRQSFVPQLNSQTNRNTRQLSHPQHVLSDEKCSNNSKSPSNVPLHLDPRGYQHSEFQTPIPVPKAGDVRRYSIPGHVAYHQDVSEQFSTFQSLEIFPVNSTSPSTLDESPSQSTVTHHRTISADKLPRAQAGWQLGWDLQQAFVHPKQFEHADDFDLDPHEKPGHAGVTSSTFDGQNDYTSPAAVSSTMMKNSSYRPTSSSCGVGDYRAETRRSGCHKDLQVFQGDMSNRSSSRCSADTIGMGRSFALVPIASARMTRRRPNIKFDVSILPAYQHHTAPVSNSSIDLFCMFD
jgi:hypothetical protein